MLLLTASSLLLTPLRNTWQTATYSIGRLVSERDVHSGRGVQLSAFEAIHHKIRWVTSGPGTEA
jgi:hypothetical protein